MLLELRGMISQCDTAHFVDFFLGGPLNTRRCDTGNSCTFPPMRTPGPVRSPTYTTPTPTNTPRVLRGEDEATVLRQEYFEKYIKMAKDATANGYLLDWKDTNPDEPRKFEWFVK